MYFWICIFEVNTNSKCKPHFGAFVWNTRLKDFGTMQLFIKSWKETYKHSFTNLPLTTPKFNLYDATFFCEILSSKEFGLALTLPHALLCPMVPWDHYSQFFHGATWDADRLSGHVRACIVEMRGAAELWVTVRSVSWWGFNPDRKLGAGAAGCFGLPLLALTTFIVLT